jgi:vitamin B12 transporter
MSKLYLFGFINSVGKNVKSYFYWLPITVLSLLIAFPAFAADNEINNNLVEEKPQPTSNISNLSEVELPTTNAQLLTQQSTSLTEVNPSPKTEQVSQAQTSTTEKAAKEESEELNKLPQSSPVYIIDKEEIRKRGYKNLAEILRGIPGFAVNDVGFGADAHSGIYLRGNTINEFVLLLNNRPININVSTYHGFTDPNIFRADSIERVEVSSGVSTALYGTEGFGGVVNIITKKGEGTPKITAGVELGSYGQANYRVGYGGADGSVKYNFNFEKFYAENDYPLPVGPAPVGATNRTPDGKLFNGDVDVYNYQGSITYDVDKNNTFSVDAYKVSSRKGLLYQGDPLQGERLNHDAFNIGFSWRSLLDGNKDSVLTTTIGFNQDYYNTYGSRKNFFQDGKLITPHESIMDATLSSQALTARVEHQWQLGKNNLLRWGADLRGSSLDAKSMMHADGGGHEYDSVEKNRFEAALFAVNTWNVADNFQIDLGLRQNFDSEKGNYLSPSAGLRYAVNPNIAVRGSWASVQRNPGLDHMSFFDMMHGWKPNADLKPESGSAWNAGVDVKFAKNFNGQFTYFGSDLNDRMPNPNTGVWLNRGLLTTKGFETGLRWNLSPQLSTFVNYTYTDALVADNPGKGLQSVTVPYSVAQAGIGYQSNGWELNLIGSYNSGPRRAVASRIPPDPKVSTLDFTPSWFNLDLAARVPLSKNVGLTFYLENLADVQYEKVLRLFQPGLTYRVGVTASF